MLVEYEIQGRTLSSIRTYTDTESLTPFLHRTSTSNSTSVTPQQQDLKAESTEKYYKYLACLQICLRKQFLIQSQT